MTIRNGILLTSSFIALVCGALACAGQESGSAGAARQGTQAQAPDDQARDEARLAAAIAREIEADPDGSTAILERNNMTRDEFEALLVEIAADPELSRTYSSALNQ